MNLYQKFRKLDIDHSAIGLEQRDTPVKYFCTPKGAKIIGCAGVDGIHYCLVKGFGETVFAVSPANLPGEYVHPIARSFEDMLSVLLACGSMAAIEQAYMWDEPTFDKYVKENRPDEAQTAAMTVIREQLGIEPMENPFAYIKELQESFDYDQLKFSAEYYELMRPVEARLPEWKVVYGGGGGFWTRKGRAGKEVAVNKQFVWGGETWNIPAIYLCSEGLVIDCCVDIDTEQIRQFNEKWNLLNASGNELTETQQEQLLSESPMRVDFNAEADVNGVKIRRNHGCGVYWIPKSCLPEDNCDYIDARFVLEHYGYDLDRGWSIHRLSFPWADKRPRSIRSLGLTLKREMTNVFGSVFNAPAAGESITLTNPITGMEHILTVHEREARELEPSHFPDDSMEYPTHYVELVYTLFPELQDFYLRDCDKGDSPRVKRQSPDGTVGGTVGLISVISGESKDTYLNPDGTSAKARVFCSSLHFEPVRELELNIVFREKRMPDIEARLI